MGTCHNKNVFRSRFELLFCFLGFLLWACSTPSSTEVGGDANVKGVLESVEAVSTPEKCTVVIKAAGARTDRKAYTLTDPPRICIDIAAAPAEDLQRRVLVPEGLVEKIMVQDRGPGHMGVVVYVRAAEYKYRLTPGEKEILLLVSPVSTQKIKRSVSPSKRETDPSAPRIVNVAVIEKGAAGTRLSIETNLNVENDITLEGNVLFIDLKNVSASTQSLQALETTADRGAIQGVRASRLNGGKDVRLQVFLRAIAPYHVVSQGNLIMVDFEALPGVATPTGSLTSPSLQRHTGSTPVALPVREPPHTPQPLKRKHAGAAQDARANVFEATSQNYAGEKMSFDFVDTDIRNILKLMADVAKLNIVWGDDVTGKISLCLDKVPWDQALEMVLKPNGLTYQIENEVLWVVPRSKLVDMEIAEKKRKGALMAAKRVQGVFEAKVVEFIIIRHRPVADIFKMLVGDASANPPIHPILDIMGAESEEKEEGEEEKGHKVKIATKDLYLSYDSGTNMLIANGVRAKVDKVKELVSKLDVPEKQVLIEARIVEAETGFARDLGIEWQSLDGDAGVRRKWYNADGTTRFDGSFSTNAPAAWAPNIGLAFGWLTDGGLGSLALDASLALAQEDQKIKIISAPKVMTVNGKEAKIERGDVDYYSVRTLDTISFQEIPAVLSLTVIPTVSADNSHVTMEVIVTDDKTKDQTTESTGEGESTSPPGRTTKEIKSTLIVKTGDTVVIGGIYQKQEQVSDSGIPFLKDIPLLGWLFKAESKMEVQVELLIFLTPTVIKSVIEDLS